MIKPNNYENIQTGDFVPPELGGHHMTIMNVHEGKTKSGKDMLIVALDFAPNDKQPGYMRKLYDGDVRPEKKWPRMGTSYIVSVDDSGECSRNFKTFITSFEDSNGCQVTWGVGPAFCQQFVGKKIGGVYGRVENEYMGERKLRTELRWFCSDAKADSQKPPKDKMLPEKPATMAVPLPGAVTDPMSGLPQVETSELPW